MSTPPQSLIARTGEALARAAAKRPDSLLHRVSERFALPQLYHQYSKNYLTHGLDFLRGDDEVPLFAPGCWHAPLKWRPIPGPGIVSLSRATLATTDEGTAMLRGVYGGSRGELPLLAGRTDSTEAAPVGAGACGVASRGHWPVDLAQHHWLELRVRTGGRAFDLVVQSDGAWSGMPNLWYASIPTNLAGDGAASDGAAGGSSGAVGGSGGAAMGDGRPPPPPPPGGQQGGGGGSAAAVGSRRRGAYGVLGVAADASDAEIREAYRELVMAVHPDRGGEEERFKAVSRAYALVADPTRRARYDELGAEGEEDEDGELDDLGPWREIKVPFTAFRDRRFYDHAEKVSAVYVLLNSEEPGGPFALEIGEIKAGRCENAHLDGAGQYGYGAACEQGHCACGYYNGLRADAFDGPLARQADGRIPPGALHWGYAEHHLRPGEVASA